MFRTEISIPPSPFNILYDHKIVCLGSCFASMMGTRLKENKFQVLTNPFGIIYNPVSLSQLLSPSLFTNAANICERDGYHYHYHAHSEISADSESALLQNLSAASTSLKETLKSAEVLILTWGTAWVYVLNSTGQIIANCHKMPTSLFSKRILTLDEIYESFTVLLNTLQSINQRLKIIVTISPVRHLKDTIPLNNLSKSLLRVACENISRLSENIFYFPAFEIMMDDLRDYRFYKEDMIHPTEVAEKYIWEKFLDCFMEQKTKAMMEKVADILKACRHRPFHTTSPAHQDFLQRTLKKMDLLPLIDFTYERNLLKSQRQD